jgi:hypothetical protein
MDLNQRKLNKSEWDSIEVPVSKSEIEVLNLIIGGFHNVNLRINNNKSLFMYLKIQYNEKIEEYVFNEYFRDRVKKIEDKIKLINPDYKNINVDGIVRLNSADKIRLERNNEESIKHSDIYETILLTHIEKILSYKKENNKKMYAFHYFTLYKLIRNNIFRLNKYIDELTKKVLDLLSEDIEISDLIENSVEFIEKNDNLLKYGDMVLYEHQKEIFSLCKNPNPKLILYMAPTGTGKTLTPIALSEQYKIIFVCAARHVGLALARAAISVNKKIAFAFGCGSSADIRLHYFAAKEYTINKRTGGIGKVDNSVGDNVEIIICDIKSYLPAMYYMLAFNKKQQIITYWDEPTITMDYHEHDFHKIIRKNWKKNKIPNMVLSSATLPKLHELTETIPDFKNKFTGCEIYNIVSHDCKKSIPIINKDGYVVLPHYLSDNYDEISKIATHCENYLTLLRYFDLKEVVEFITYVLKNNMSNSKMILTRHFESLDDINMKNIKIYYVKLLKNIIKEHWTNIYTHFTTIRKPRILSNETVDPKGNKITKSKSVGPGLGVFNPKSLNGAPLSRVASEQITSSPIQHPIGTSGAYITTKDAYTLTDGPTIFISNDIEKIAKFCIQQANIPSIVMDDIMKKIQYNNVLNTRLAELESNYDIEKDKIESTVKNSVGSLGRNKSTKDIRKFNREDNTNDGANKNLLKNLTNEMNSIKSMIKNATLNETFVPNKSHHIEKWALGLNTQGAFTSDIDEYTVNNIMALDGIDDSWKILLLMGIGVFINHENIKYTEIMKKLADEQKLYMIIASSDYIYGTNYQFCHGYLSKDLDLTQEKIIQGMGRIGRNNIQQTYTVRFRDDSQIAKLFTSETEKPEIINMNKLFNSKKVLFENNVYTEVEDEEVDEEDEECDNDEDEDEDEEDN